MDFHIIVFFVALLFFGILLFWYGRTINLLIAFIRQRGFYLVYRIIKLHFLQFIGVPKLQGLLISPSHYCNANCANCYEKFPDKKETELSTDEIKKLIDQLYDLGGYMITFCSGEFLLRKDAIDLIDYAGKKHLLVNLVTNGILLNESVINNLKSAKLANLIVSIYSSDPLKHDEYRGVKGCFNKAVEGLRLAKEKGLYTQIWVYAEKANLEDIEKVVELGNELNVDIIYVYFIILSGRCFNKFDKNLSIEERKMIREKFKNKKRVGLTFPDEKTMCHGGKKYINVMPTGDITFCGPVPYSYGNIRENLLKESLIKIRKERDKFHKLGLTGQCIVNFPEFHEQCEGKFIYTKDNLNN